MFTSTSTLTAFAGHRRIATGSPMEVAMQARTYLDAEPEAQLLVFDVHSGKQVELDLRGTANNVRSRLEAEPRQVETSPKPAKGRPKLGVVAREVTLLPHHWNWLASQPGGASVTLRKLIMHAMANPEPAQVQRMRLAAAYNFMFAVAGNEPGFDEVSRALFAAEATRLKALLESWPTDVADQILTMAGLDELQ